MSLKLYYDLLSQPARALYIFLKVNNIPFEGKFINLAQRDHYEPDYEKINPVKKIPAIEHNGFALAESIAIVRYLSREFKVDDHWYPKDSKAQAKVDEYLEWQHLNTRLACAGYVQAKLLRPLLTGKPPRPERVTEFEGRMTEALDLIENVWLKDRPFLTGTKISFADILATCEVEQPIMAGFSPCEGRPKLTAWMERVKKETSPHYEVAHVYVNKMADKFKQSPLSRL